MASDWDRIDLPVLRALVAHFEDCAATLFSVARIASATGLKEAEVKEALDRISSASPPYLEGRSAWGEGYQWVKGITERARLEVAQRPRSEARAGSPKDMPPRR